MSSSRVPPSADQPDATDNLLAQFAAEKTHVVPGKDGTINYKSQIAMAGMAFGGPLRLPRKEDDQYEGSLPPPSYSTATGQPETSASSHAGKRTNALGREIDDSGSISGWWSKRKERKDAEKASSGAA